MWVFRIFAAVRLKYTYCFLHFLNYNVVLKIYEFFKKINLDKKNKFIISIQSLSLGGSKPAIENETRLTAEASQAYLRLWLFTGIS